jgi:hypothetical protein
MHLSSPPYKVGHPDSRLIWRMYELSTYAMVSRVNFGLKKKKAYELILEGRIRIS